MADEMWEDIATALSTIVSTTHKSGNMKKELKNTISETVITLRKLLFKLKEISESKTKAISDLETAVIRMTAQCEDGREKCNKGCAAPSFTPSREPVVIRAQGHAAPSVIISQEPAGSRDQGAAPPGDRREKLCSAALGNNTQHQHFKITVKSKKTFQLKQSKRHLNSK
jgi:hypothetical protein